MVQKRYVWLIKLLHLFHICLRFREAIIPSLQGISFIATWTSAPRLPQTEVPPLSSSHSKQDDLDDDPDDDHDDDPDDVPDDDHHIVHDEFRPQIATDWGVFSSSRSLFQINQEKLK